MRAGALRHKLCVEKKTQEQDPISGAVTTSWRTFVRVSGAIEPLSAREIIAAKAVQSDLSARIKIRHIYGLDASMRVVDEATGEIYTLAGPPIPDNKSGKEWITLVVSSGLAEQ